MLIAVYYVLVLCLIYDLLLNLDRFLVVTNIVNRRMLLGFAPHILQVDGALFDTSDDCLDVRHLLVLLI